MQCSESNSAFHLVSPGNELMAIVLLALNGEGLGHIVRSTIVCDALKSVGERPIFFSQGTYHPSVTQYPGDYVPSLWRAPKELRRRVASDLYTMAAISF